MKKRTLLPVAVPALVKMMKMHGAEEATHCNPTPLLDDRKKALQALVKAGGNQARRLALSTGAPSEWFPRSRISSTLARP